jgi:Protein of unknown function (DUF3501)
VPLITRDSLMTLESYARAREEMRAEVIAHKTYRKVHLGDNITLIFEDETTIRYQIQEMLRAEKTFEEAGIVDELATYNALVPDGHNWKATMMIEYTDPAERAVWLAKLIGVEDTVWIEVHGHDRVYAIADEDIERENEIKTSAVHFLRFELTPPMIQALKQGKSLGVGVDHPVCQISIESVDAAVRTSLTGDLIVRTVRS